MLTPAACAKLIRSSRAVVALTGAGLSTAAGVPDFRGPQGLYVTRRYDPEKVFEIGWFRREPQHFYAFSRDFVATVKDVQPTFTHRFLARLEEQGRLLAVVTQNIDLLHQQAGSRSLVELHGSYAAASCGSCGRAFTQLSYAWWQQAMLESPDPPIARCSACGGLLKPDIVFFGELVHGMSEAERLIAGCDLLLVLGSSLQVAPAALLPSATEAPTVIVNQGEVALSEAPQRYFVAAELDDYFRQVAESLAAR
jgi:NAD-dependent protein deacetylase/lipoamidase